MKIAVADREGKFTFAAADANRDVMFLGDSALVLDSTNGDPVMQEVKAGQIWRDRDPRQETKREFIVERVEGDYAYCLTKANALHLGRHVRIALRRFRPTNTGYDLVSENNLAKPA